MNPEKIFQKLHRNEDSHKGENGKVGIIAGSKDFSGPPAFNAEASLKAGADLVKILTSHEVRDVVRSYSENYIVDSYESDYFDQEALKKDRELDEWSDCIVLGSGLSNPSEEALKKSSKDCKSPFVVDAEAIRPLVSEGVKAVYTPHKKEKEDIEELYGGVEEFCQITDSVVVVTGPEDIIYTDQGVFRNETGSSTMTVGGTGDLLAGLIASMIAQGLDPVEASRLAVYINGKAGELANNEIGNGATAKDIARLIPEAFNNI